MWGQIGSLQRYLAAISASDRSRDRPVGIFNLLPTMQRGL